MSGPVDSQRPLPAARPWLVAALMGAVLAVVGAGLILLGPTPARIAYDQNGFHLPTIRTFAAQWPTPDLRDYLSATTPGYHLALAGASRVVGESVVALRFVGLLFSVGLAATLGWALGRRLAWPIALACGAPVVASLYVIGPAAWLLPDNASLWAVLGVLLLAGRGKADVFFFATTGLLMVAVVLTRQMHVWVLAPVVVAAWLAIGAADADERAGGPAPLFSRGDLLGLFERPVARALRVLAALAAVAPAVLLLWAFVKLWGGLTPAGTMVPEPPAHLEGPANFARVGGGNAATPALILALWGIYGLFFSGYLLGPLADLWRRARWVVLAAAVVGALAASVPVTAPSVEAGRWTGLWQIAAKLPVIGGRTSVLLLALAPVGAVLLAAAAHGLAPRWRWLLLGSVSGFAAAQSASMLSWQRYIEPCLLMFMALACAALASTETASASASAPVGLPRWTRWAGPLALAALLAVVTVSTVWG